MRDIHTFTSIDASSPLSKDSSTIIISCGCFPTVVENVTDLDGSFGGSASEWSHCSRELSSHEDGEGKSHTVE
jgi:hypothetical protein